MSRITRIIAAGLVVILGVGLVVALAWRDTNRPALRTLAVPVQGLRHPQRILHVSDLHGARFGDRQAYLAQLVDGRHYDAVVLTGDEVLVRGADSEPAAELVDVLKQVGPVFFVRGNHDDDGVAPRLAAAGGADLDAFGVVRIGPDDGALVLSTVGAAGQARKSPSDGVVILEHTPLSASYLAALAVSADPAVVLSGHTHGGNYRLPFVGALICPPMGDSPEWTLFPEAKGLHVSGLRQREGVWAHISRGLGAGTRSGVPRWLYFRLGSRAEMTEIVLVPKADN